MAISSQLAGLPPRPQDIAYMNQNANSGGAFTGGATPNFRTQAQSLYMPQMQPFQYEQNDVMKQANSPFAQAPAPVAAPQQEAAQPMDFATQYEAYLREKERAAYQPFNYGRQPNEGL